MTIKNSSGNNNDPSRISCTCFVALSYQTSSTISLELASIHIDFSLGCTPHFPYHLWENSLGVPCICLLLGHHGEKLSSNIVTVDGDLRRLQYPRSF